jgi:hypothetical protein
MITISPGTLTWRRRCGLAAFVLAGTAVYAASFGWRPSVRTCAPVAVSVALAAGVSWIGFGSLLWAVTRRRLSWLAWADVCLPTMATGNAVLSVSVLLNGAGVLRGDAVTPALMVAHGAILLAANVVMGIGFCSRAKSLGLRAGQAALLWIGGLDGLFAALLWGLWPGGGLP